ncbi:MAG TPA: hypothetical protein PL131_11195 [Methylotenera sp.]|nr:hypothetical protein [Methylotenera sp.]HPH06432.1 hypothetical protein [Methylotenera sp.]HPN00421.1 hypothetical protein [Methylotenera sp.]
MNKKIISLIYLAALTGCATSGTIQNKTAESTHTSSNVATNTGLTNATLRTLYKPKNSIGRDLKGVVTKEVILDYSAQAPKVQESSEIQNLCSSSGLVKVTNSEGMSIVDTQAYSQAVALGKEAIQMRAIWKFNIEETNKADQAVPRQRYEQTKAARAQKEQRDQDAGYVTRTGRLDSRKLSKDILRGLGLEKKDPVVERQKAEENAYEEFKRDLDYNRSVLAAQDQQISSIEQNYVSKLSSVYNNALNNLISIPVSSIGTETLKQFSRFRTDNIYECIYARTSSKVSWPSELVNDRSFANSPYEKYATSVVIAGADDAIKKFKASTTSAGIETEFSYLYPTDDLKRVAFNTPAVASVFKARSTQIKAEEQRKYEEQQRRLAEESARQAKLKIKNNSSPSVDDVQRAILKASVEKTNGELKLSHTVITSGYSYDKISNILGYEFKSTEMRIAVENLTCRKEGIKQRCSYDERYKEIPFVFGAAVDVNSEKQVRRNSLFYWTMEGLIAEKAIEVAYYIPPPPSSGTNSSPECIPDPRFPACGVSASDAIQYRRQLDQIHNN